MRRVVIVGAGAAGLSCAEALIADERFRRVADLLVLEAAGEPGGKIGSDLDGGFVFERGPHGLLDHAPDTLALISRLGLEGRTVRPGARARRRFVLSGGRLHALPTGPAAFLRTPLLPLRAKLRALAEPFVRRRADHEESIAEFFARRFGSGVVGPLVDPFVTGVFGGDPERLSMSAALPRVWRLEREHGSVLRGLLAQGRRPPPSPFSFRGGMAELPSVLAARIGSRLRLRARVERIVRDGAGFRLAVAGEASPRPARPEEVGDVGADVLVLAVPAPAAARLVEGFDRDLSRVLDTIPYAPVAVVCLAYRAREVARPPDGFGYLRARGEEHPLLGCIFASTVFAEHAPEGFVSLRALLGGAREPERVSLSEDELVATARRALEPLLSIRGEPVRARVFRHERAIPQYTLGHLGRLAALEAKRREHPALLLTGAAYRGISVNDCVADGRTTAARVLRLLGSEAGTTGR